MASIFSTNLTIAARYDVRTCGSCEHAHLIAYDADDLPFADIVIPADRVDHLAALLQQAATLGPREIITTSPASSQKAQTLQWQCTADKIADHATLSPPGNEADQAIDRADDTARRGK
jgi:hypothetical protein